METKVLAILALFAVTYPLVRAARVKPHRGSAHEPEEEKCPDGKICTDAPCDVVNSNMADGKACACLPGYAGEVTWSDSTPSGTCAPVPCDHISGAIGEGPGCRCMSGLIGEITWDADKPKGECVGECLVEALELFEPESGTFKFKAEEDSEKDIKCCVSTKGAPSLLQDLNAPELPSEGSTKRGLSRYKTGCGYMFGNSYHSGARRLDSPIDQALTHIALGGEKSRPPTCPVAVTTLMAATGLTFYGAMQLFEGDVMSARCLPNDVVSVLDKISDVAS